MIKSADISQCGVYRYGLIRAWGTAGVELSKKRAHLVLPIVMLNPSTADANVDDPTIRRCMGFARREGYGGILVGNLFALRSMWPAQLYDHPDPIGPENNGKLTMLLNEARTSGAPVLCAWGVHGGFDRRDEWFKRRAKQVGTDLVHLGLTKDGHPKHPLYIKGEQPFGVLYS